MKDLQVFFFFKTTVVAENICPLICLPGRVKRVMFYMVLSFIMYELVETDALIPVQFILLQMFKYNLKISLT